MDSRTRLAYRSLYGGTNGVNQKQALASGQCPKGGCFTEQLNIEGKRSGQGFVVHKAQLVKALLRALSERVMLLDITIGRKGLLGYLKALGGSNIVKVVPAADGASDSQANGNKGLKVICGTNTGHLMDTAWIGEKTPMTICEVRVSPKNSVKPNIGAEELAEAIDRVLPFTAIEDNRPVLQHVLFTAKEGKLTLVGADGFRLAVANLDYDDGEGQSLISRDELMGVANALRKARRVKVSFDKSALAIDTELIRYQFNGGDGTFPDYFKLVPTEFAVIAHFDTVEAVKAVSSLKALADSKAYPIDLAIGDGKLIMSNPDDKGQTELAADTEGQGKIRVDGSYLASVLRACGGMVDLKSNKPNEPMLFTSDGYQVVVMPMITSDVRAEKAEAGVKAEAKVETEVVETKVITEAEKIIEAKNTEDKPKRHSKPKHQRQREAVTVA